MGLFSSKKVITAGVSVSHIVEEKPDIMRDAVITSVMTGRPVSDVILANGVRGFSTKVEKYYKFGKEEYSLGLPGGSTVGDTGSEAAVKAVLDTIAPSPVVIENFTVSTPDEDFVTFQYLQNEYGFRHSDKKFLTAPVSGSTRDFYYSSQVLNNQGLLVIEYYSTAANTPNETGYLTVQIPNYAPERLHYNVSYTLANDPENELLFWVYNASNETYPSLNVSIITDGTTEYLPTITIRMNKKNLVTDQSSEEFITAERMAKALSIDIMDMTQKLLSTENGNDPNVIDSAFLVFAANVQSESKSTIKYLYQYLKHMEQSATTDKDKWNAWIAGGKTGEAPVNLIDITDGRMRTSIFYNYMESNFVLGTIGNIGKLTRETVLLPAEGEVEYSKLIFRKQITPTGYEEFTIHGLKHVSHAYPGEIVVRTLEDSTKLGEDLKPDGGFFFPVTRTVALKIPAIDRTTMYLDSLAVVVYTVQITKVKWYQQGWFRAVLVVLAIVYAVYTQDWSQVGNAIAALKAVGTVIVTLIVNSIVIKAFALLANMIGGDVAAIITTIVAIYAISQGALSGDNALPWAKDLLNAAMLSYQGIQVNLQQNFLDMQKDFMEFLKTEQEQLQELKEKQDSFEQGIDLLYLMSPQYYFDPYETPDEFYQRTVENKNPGVLSFEALSEYFNRKLTLPKLSASDIITGYSEQNSQ